jgi:hypothetical protein
VGYGLAPVGAVAGGAIARAFGLRAAFLFGGALVSLSAVLLGIWLNERTIEAARRGVVPRRRAPTGESTGPEVMKLP